MSKLITDNYRLHIANQLIESVSEVANTAYYLYVGNHVPYANTTVPTANNDQRTVYIDAYRNMIMGKRVGVNDIKLMIRNIPYVSNTVYAMYDDRDSELLLKDYYVIVNEGSYLHVYKCLDNNQGIPSSVQPEFAHVSGSNTALYQTSDGYRWKYMYTIDSSVNQKFATTEYFPLSANTIVMNNAVSGAIDIIKIENGGKGYDNYISGTFSASNIKYTGISTLYEIPNDNASQINGFYEGCILYISNGPGSGAYRSINGYSIQSGKKIISISSAFDLSNAPAAGSDFEIFPEVRVYGDGTESTVATARALVNSTASNSIYRVELLNRGADYKYFTANVIANSVVQVERNASVRPIYSSPGGHGKNQDAELNAKNVCISIKFANNESNTILSTNDFQQIGVLKDPLFANVQIEYDTLVGSFSTGEKVYKIDPVRLATNASISTVSDIIECVSTDFTEQVKSGDYIYIKSGDNTNHQLTTVVEVSNVTHIKIASNGFFSCTESFVYQANVSSSGYVLDIEPDYIFLSNVAGIIQTSDMIIGEFSGAQMNVNSISRNNKQKTFNTFIQLNKYDATLNSLTFEQNELIYQGTSFNNQVSNASLHSVINTTGSEIEIYASNQVGDFIVGDIVTGETSEATATINTVYSPEIVFGSGDILYIENIESVTRTANESENFKVIFEF
jgi:hypothetical protein